MELKIPTIAYDKRKFNGPWIARVDFDKLSQPLFTVGRWVGIAGRPGMLHLIAQPGDIVAIGMRLSDQVNWYQLTEQRKLRKLESKYAAWIHYLMRPIISTGKEGAK